MTGTPRIVVLNGPNLNLLGVRQPEIYGRETLAEIEAACRRDASAFGMSVEFRQSNAEHDLVAWIQDARTAADALIINPAGFTSTSVAIFDALSMCAFPIVEVHLSNIHRREAFRTPSYVSLLAGGVICGCGGQGYTFALQRVARVLGRSPA